MSIKSTIEGKTLIKVNIFCQPILTTKYRMVYFIIDSVPKMKIYI